MTDTEHRQQLADILGWGRSVSWPRLLAEVERRERESESQRAQLREARRHIGPEAAAEVIAARSWDDPTADLRTGTGTPVPTVCRTIAYYAGIAGERRLTPAEVDGLYIAAGACGDVEVLYHHAQSRGPMTTLPDLSTWPPPKP